MKPNKTLSQAIKRRPYRSGALFLTGAALAAAITLLVVLPAKLSGECICSEKSAELVYEVTYDKVTDEVSARWVWVQQALFDAKGS